MRALSRNPVATGGRKNGKLLRSIKSHTVAVVCLNWEEDGTKNDLHSQLKELIPEQQVLKCRILFRYSSHMFLLGNGGAHIARDKGLDVRLLCFFTLTPMDKSWIEIRNRLDSTYIQGVEKFIEFAYDKKHPDSKIYCPCKKCVNLIFGTRSGVKEHLIINGFNTKYTRWTIHGESLASSSRNESDANQSSYFQDDMIGMVHDAFGVPRQDGGIRDNEELESMGLGPDKETKNFFSYC
ncbi:hypothetical protein RHGRI_034504 [Rhododendron griersonianum]|uniref:Transposase-associated domain-containing protein n=1 Tax=Rhododendron griersonianum TaxID=479676 RepID=A0AAV6I452_9ERIC|nr:hypothetical protein RHGRI_034504 [Rhododendron griersonianum]